MRTKKVVFVTQKKKYHQDLVNIANISFAYDNHRIINLLIKRGTQISQGRFQSVLETENRIAKEIELNEEKIIRPVTAFITFETQEARERCIKYFSFRENIFGSSRSAKDEDCLQIFG